MTDLYRHNGGEPGPLPFQAQTPTGEWRTDLANHPESRLECGFVLAPAKPAFDPKTQVVTWSAASARWIVSPIPASPPAAPVYQRISRLAFVRLAEDAGGMTPEKKVAAYKDPAFEAFWIDFQMAEEIARDDAGMMRALAGLEAKGYLPNGARKVLLAWPTQ